MRRGTKNTAKTALYMFLGKSVLNIEIPHFARHYSK
jgi:hypothetical protein